MSGSPARAGGGAGAPGSLATSKGQPHAQTVRAPAAQAVASRLSDPQFKIKEQTAAKVVMMLKNEDKKAYPKDAANPEVQFGGRFIHNKQVRIMLSTT